MTLPRKFINALAASCVLLAACSVDEQEVDNVTIESQSAEEGAVLFSNFVLIDGTDRLPTPDSAMIVQEGVINWIGQTASAQRRPGMQEVDLAGAYIMPGLIDLHVHLSVLHDGALSHEVFTPHNVNEELLTYASYGVTSVLSMGTEKDFIFDLIDSQRNGLPDRTRVYAAGHGVVYEGGYGGVDGINNPVSTPEETIAEVQAQADKGVDVIKIWVDDEFGSMPLMPPEITQAAIDTAHENGLRAVAHIFKLEDTKRLIAQGIDGLVHSVRDEVVDEEYLELIRQHDVWQVSSTLSREAAMFAYAEHAPFLDDPFFTRSVDAEVLDRLRSEEYQESVRQGPHFQDFVQIMDVALENTRRAVAADTKVAFGTDSGPPGRFPGYSAHWELELLVESGMTPQQAIVSATRNAAEFLEADRLGTLETGKFADFIILQNNPLVDIRHTRSIESVYIAGAQIYP